MCVLSLFRGSNSLPTHEINFMLAIVFVLINPFNYHRGCKYMRNKFALFSSSAILLILLVIGLFYIDNQPAESQQPQDTSYVNEGLSPNVYSFEDLTPKLGILVAMANCGSETCSAQQCCCLNTDTGAQCCRPKQSGNCVESCKRSKPC